MLLVVSLFVYRYNFPSVFARARQLELQVLESYVQLTHKFIFATHGSSKAGRSHLLLSSGIVRQSLPRPRVLCHPRYLWLAHFCANVVSIDCRASSVESPTVCQRCSYVERGVCCWCSLHHVRPFRSRSGGRLSLGKDHWSWCLWKSETCVGWAGDGGGSGAGGWRVIVRHSVWVTHDDACRRDPRKNRRTSGSEGLESKTHCAAKHGREGSARDSEFKELQTSTRDWIVRCRLVL
mgnify:CR=1 FL=1